MIYRLIIFLVFNFGALAIGGLFTGNGVTSDWYTNMNKAPWTPPGWVFGAAWTVIMICFSIYMANAWARVEDNKVLLPLYIVQLLLNISWNPIFFYYNNVWLALITIVLLTLLIAFMLFFYWHQLKLISITIVPYLVWLLIATSLNAYIYFKN